MIPLQRHYLNSPIKSKIIIFQWHYVWAIIQKNMKTFDFRISNKWTLFYVQTWFKMFIQRRPSLSFNPVLRIQLGNSGGSGENVSIPKVKSYLCAVILNEKLAFSPDTVILMNS